MGPGPDGRSNIFQKQTSKNRFKVRNNIIKYKVQCQSGGKFKIGCQIGFHCDLRFAICVLRFAICDFRFAISYLRFPICYLRFAICDFITTERGKYCFSKILRSYIKIERVNRPKILTQILFYKTFSAVLVLKPSIKLFTVAINTVTS